MAFSYLFDLFGSIRKGEKRRKTKTSTMKDTVDFKKEREKLSI